MNERDKYDERTRKLLPCPRYCAALKHQSLPQNQHAFSCPHKYRPVVAAELRKLTVDNLTLKADRDMWIVDDAKQNTALGRVIKERDDLRIALRAEAERVTERDAVIANNHECVVYKEACYCEAHIAEAIRAAQHKETSGLTTK